MIFFRNTLICFLASLLFFNTACVTILCDYKIQKITQNRELQTKQGLNFNLCFIKIDFKKKSIKFKPPGYIEKTQQLINIASLSKIISNEFKNYSLIDEDILVLVEIINDNINTDFFYKNNAKNKKNNQIKNVENLFKSDTNLFSFINYSRSIIGNLNLNKSLVFYSVSINKDTPPPENNLA